MFKNLTGLKNNCSIESTEQRIFPRTLLGEGYSNKTKIYLQKSSENGRI